MGENLNYRILATLERIEAVLSEQPKTQSTVEPKKLTFWQKLKALFRT